MSINFDFDDKINIILNKKFNSKIHAGYDPVDVDSFFDEVIEYIENVKKFYKDLEANKNAYTKEIDSLKLTIEQLKKENNELKTEINDLKKDGYSNIKIIEKI